MLIEFSVGNYLSFKNPVTFSMVASKINATDKKLDIHNLCKIDDELSLLKSAAIYGANGSGKSNLAAAMQFARWFVLNSALESLGKDAIAVERFRLSTETEGKPSLFEMVFLLNGKIHRYGFEVTAQQVVSEWLFYVPVERETRLFERKLDIFDLSDAFEEGRGIANKTRENALFLSVVAQFKGEISGKILLWFENFIAIGGKEEKLYCDAALCVENDQCRQEILQFLKKLDAGIDDIQIDNAPQKTIQTMRRKYDTEGQPISLEVFDMEAAESEGTKKLFALSYPIVDALKNGKVLVIDEFDVRLHPLASRAIAELFNSNETNPRPAQFIFIAYHTNLLSNKVFRRDQIWFTAKDGQGATELYSLVEYKMRNDASFESDYLRGKYGAVPAIAQSLKFWGEPNE